MDQGTLNTTTCVFDMDAYCHSFEAKVVAISGAAVMLNRTCFYPTGGGQPGDTGVLSAGALSLAVTDTHRDADDLRRIWHVCATGAETLHLGMAVSGRIDWDRRYAHMRLHTCLHLLCSLIAAPITGCGISQDKGRLDFDLPDAAPDKDEIGRMLNRLVIEDHPVRRFHLLENVQEEVARLTRTAAVVPPVIGGAVSMVEIVGVDLQPCGGTHVASTAEIGPVRCSKIEKKSRSNRRISVVFN